MDKYSIEEVVPLGPDALRIVKFVSKWVARIVGGVVALIFVLMLGLLTRLAFSPIDLTFLKPRLDEKLAQVNGHIHVQVGGLQMVWNRLLRPYEVVMTDVRIKDDLSGKDTLAVPEIGMSLWLSELLFGNVDLRSLYIYSPKLVLNKDPKEGFMVKLNDNGKSEPFSFEEMTQLLMVGRGQDELGPLSSVRKIKIVDADVILRDDELDEVWKLPKTTFILHRYYQGFRLRAHFKPRKSGLFTGVLKAELKHRVGSSRADMTLSFDQINLGELVEENRELFKEDEKRESGIEQFLEVLHGLDFPIKGSCHVAVAPQTGQLIEGTFKLNAGVGRFNWFGQDVPVNEFYIDAGATPHSLEVKHAALVLEESNISATAHLDSPHALLKIHQPLQPGVTLKANLEGEDINVARLDKIWPPEIAPGAQRWITKEIPKGFVPSVDVDYKAHVSDEGQMELDSLTGEMDMVGLSINFYEGLPFLENVGGKALFDQKSFHITVEEGHVEGVELDKGTIHITDLDIGDEKMDLDLELTGPLGDVLDIINHKPLQYADEAHLDPKRTTGDGSIHLKMAFPLLADLDLDQIKLDIDAEFKDVVTEMDLGSFPIRLEEGDMKIIVDEKHLDLKSQGTLNKVESTSIGAKMNFREDKTDPWETQVVVETRVKDTDLARHGYDYREFIAGPADLTVTFEVLNDIKSRLSFDFGLQDMIIDVPQVGWKKKGGAPASFSFAAEIDKGDFRKIKGITLKSDFLTFKGQGDFDTQGDVHAIYLTGVKAPHTDADMSVIWPKGGGYELHFNGKQINAEPFMEYLDHDKSKTKRKKSTHLKVTSNVQVLRMGEGREFRDVQSNLDLIIEPTDVKWMQVRLVAAAGTGVATKKKGEMADEEGGISLDLTLPQNKEQSLEVRANDAGQLLKNLDLYDKVKGGNLIIKATRSLGQPFEGTFKLKDFDGTDIPLAGRLAAVLSPAGIANLFSEDKQLFINEFRCNFTFDEQEVTFSEGTGKSIGVGFTTQGKMDRINRQFDVKGNIIPAYVLNSILNNIPIVGSLLSGGKGEGLFAIEYSVRGPFDDPQINVNPLTALAPGFIRNLFGD